MNVTDTHGGCFPPFSQGVGKKKKATWNTCTHCIMGNEHICVKYSPHKEKQVNVKKKTKNGETLTCFHTPPLHYKHIIISDEKNKHTNENTWVTVNGSWCSIKLIKPWGKYDTYRHDVPLL